MDKLRRTSLIVTCLFFNSHSGGGVQTGSRKVGHFWPAPGDCEDGKFDWMKIGRGNRNTRRKPVPGPFCPPQIPLDQTRTWTRAAAVGSQRLTAWAMAWPSLLLIGFEVLTSAVMKGRSSHCYILVSCCEDGGNIFLRNVCWFSPDCMALHPRR
jgi:hypothetical protein